jgi:hypothetical protein
MLFYSTNTAPSFQQRNYYFTALGPSQVEDIFLKLRLAVVNLVISLREAKVKLFIVLRWANMKIIIFLR